MKIKNQEHPFFTQDLKGNFIKDFPFELPLISGKIDIKLGVAKPLTKKEEANRAMLAYQTPLSQKNVVTASAEAERALMVLFSLSRSGNGKALWQLTGIIIRCVEGLNEIAHVDPEAMAAYAKNIPTWPMMRSIAPLLCDNDKLLKRIKLGEATGFTLDRYSKWKPDFASQIAAALYRHIEALRGNRKVFILAERRILFSKFLAPYNQETAEEWWKYAEMFLVGSYPKLEQVKELKALVTAKSKLKSPGRCRAAILEKIRARFIHQASRS